MEYTSHFIPTCIAHHPDMFHSSPPHGAHQLSIEMIVPQVGFISQSRDTQLPASRQSHSSRQLHSSSFISESQHEYLALYNALNCSISALNRTINAFMRSLYKRFSTQHPSLCRIIVVTPVMSSSKDHRIAMFSIYLKH